LFKNTDIHYQAAASVRGSTLCSYLIGLAAVRRGLDVSYETYLGDASKAFFRSRPDFTGAYLKIGDGRHTLFFDRSRGEKSMAVTNNTAVSKSHAKTLLQHRGISTPAGRDFSKKSVAAAQKFLAGSARAKFIMKPVDGSLGRGVILGLSPEEIIKTLQKKDTPWIVEEMISGPEYRVYVVDNSAVAAFERIAPYVVGDGVRTIEQLIDARNHSMSANPHSAKSTVDTLAATRFLATAGRNLGDKLKYLEQASLDARKFAPGRDIKDVTNTIPAAVTTEAVKALRALGLPNGGVDVLYDSNDNRPYVLEVNPRAHIGGHSFPTIGDGQGLAVPDAILDYYFPTSKANKRHNNFGLDFAAIQTALASCAIERISPLAPKDEWILRHVPLNCSCDQAQRVVDMLRLVTIHVNWWQRTDGDNRIDAYFLKPGLEGFHKTVKGSRTAVVTREVDQLICSAP
jgi:D-alanine-D-alanine ligase-like ATP-grasp enzyme